MNNLNKLPGYFREGFLLTNRSIEVLLFGITLSLIDTIIPPSAFLLTLLLLYPITANGLSYSLFLSLKQGNKKLSFRFILETTLKNTKRIILPATLLFIGFTTLAIIILFSLIFFVYNGQVPKISPDFFNRPFNPFYLGMIILFSPLTFTGIFFSLKDDGLLTSIKKSVQLFLKTIPFIISITTVSYLVYSLSNLIPNNELWGKIIQSIFFSYTGLLFSAITLIFFKKEVEK